MLRFKQDVGKLEQVPKRVVAKMLRGLENRQYDEERLHVMGVFSLEKRRLSGT